MTDRVLEQLAKYFALDKSDARYGSMQEDVIRNYNVPNPFGWRLGGGKYTRLMSNATAPASMQDTAYSQTVARWNEDFSTVATNEQAVLFMIPGMSFHYAERFLEPQTLEAQNFNGWRARQNFLYDAKVIQPEMLGRLDFTREA